MKERIALCVADSSFQEKMLRETELSLVEAIEISKVAELSKQRAQTVHRQNIDIIYRKTPKSRWSVGVTSRSSLTIQKHKSGKK